MAAGPGVGRDVVAVHGLGRVAVAVIGRGTALVLVCDFHGLFGLFNVAADRVEPVGGEIYAWAAAIAERPRKAGEQ